MRSGLCFEPFLFNVISGMTSLTSSSVAGLKGTARVPGDKSISHRALMFGALADGETVISGLLEGEDVLRTAKALISMGTFITPPDIKGGMWRVAGMGKKPLRSPRTTLYLGNSGTSTRLLLGIAAGYPVSATFTGDESLSKRPMGRVIKPLSLMGARFEATSGDKLPLRIVGSASLRPIQYTLPVASAQVKSAILLAGLHAQGETVVIEPKPTRDHTEKMLAYFGADISTELQPDGSNIITLSGFPQLYAHHVIVPADPSSAAFLTVAALITPDSDILIPNVLMNKSRTGLYDTLIEMGGDITFENEREASGESVADIRVKSSALKGIDVPRERVPSMIDEFPVLAVAASFANGKTYMSDLAELRVKESDRLAVVAQGLANCGVKTEMGEESLTVFGNGGPPQGGGFIETHLDHRIAMSFLVMGLAAKEAVTIDDSETINTSFPDFVGLLNTLGAHFAAAGATP